jgi:hypothetical protein
MALARTQASISRLIGAIAAAATVLAVAPAQVSPSASVPKGVTQPPEPRGRLVDRVIGVYGERVIMESSIRSELEARIAGIRGANRPAPTPEEIESLKRGILGERLRQLALAQDTLNLQSTTREKVETIVKRYLDEETQQEVERAGSFNRFSQDLGVLGRSLDSVNEERRTEMLAQIAVSENMRRRWQDRFALAVTPREMKEYYEAHRDVFVREPTADLEIIALPAGADVEAARAKAQQAAAAWREAARPTNDVAAEFGAIVLDPQLDVRNTPNDPRAQAIKEFAGRAADGDVSEPIERASHFWILRVAARHDGIERAFSDPSVQADILEKLVEQKLNAENDRLILKNQQKFRSIR